MNDDMIHIGPNTFANNERTVVSWDGQSYYKPCGLVVAQLDDGGFSTCVKPINHVNLQHEDYDGRTSGVRETPDGEVLTIPIPRLTNGEPITKFHVNLAWAHYIMANRPAEGEDISIELATLMGIVRTVNNALPELVVDEESTDGN